MNQITEVQIIPIKPKDGLIGFASFVLDQKIYLGSIGIHTKLNGNGFRLTYPTKKVSDKNVNLFHPINREFGMAIEKAILTKAEVIFSEKCNEGCKNAGHFSFNAP